MERKVPDALRTLAGDELLFFDVVSIRMGQAVRWARNQRQAWLEVNAAAQLAEPTEIPVMEVAFPEELKLAA